MVKADYFKHCKKRIMKIHTLVSLTLFKYRQDKSAWYHLQNADERWRDKESTQEVMKVLDCLDFFLDQGMLNAYLEQFEMLWPLLNESRVGGIIYDKIVHKFGSDCFFLQYD